ncbi:metallophosphoesterase [Ursidibacter sp. B-7004-1]
MKEKEGVLPKEDKLLKSFKDRSLLQQLDCTQYRQVYIVGDIHGCYSDLRKLLNEINFDYKNDLLVSVGDIIDRGTENIACLKLLNKPWFKMVLGNHDEAAYAAVTLGGSKYLFWQQKIGGSWFERLSKNKQKQAVKLIERFADIPLVLELNFAHHKIIVCHADYPLNYYNSRDIKRFSVKNIDKILFNRSRVFSEDYTVIKGANYFVHGHTPLQSPVLKGNRFYLDTGVFNTHNLTLLKVDNTKNKPYTYPIPYIVDKPRFPSMFVWGMLSVLILVIGVFLLDFFL